MKKKDEKQKEKVEVKYRTDSDMKTKIIAEQLQEIFNGPIFARMVREAVEDMVMEGKLTYDIETDMIDVPEDIVRRWAASMEKKKWSRSRKKRT